MPCIPCTWIVVIGCMLSFASLTLSQPSLSQTGSLSQSSSESQSQSTSQSQSASATQSQSSSQSQTASQSQSMSASPSPSASQSQSSSRHPDPFSLNSIVALRLSNSGAALSDTYGNTVFLDEISTSGVHLRTRATPSLCTIGGASQAPSQAPDMYEGRLTLSPDEQVLSYICLGASAGSPVASANRKIISVNSSGLFSSPVDTASTGVGVFSAVRAYDSLSSGSYFGDIASLRYVVPGGGSNTVLLNSHGALSVAIFANSLCAYRLIGALCVICTRTAFPR
jgi:hypothetical protein